ncbi:MAG: GTPase Era [Bacteroidota bacterium]
MADEIVPSADYRCGYVAIIGEPNVGKSTLMNRLLGQKISIVTKKPQTTRHRILGILSTDSFQAIFVDTPGIIRPRYALHEAMMEHASSAIRDADMLLYMIDAAHPPDPGDRIEEEALARLKETGKPAWLVINKVDLVEKPLLLPMMERYARRFPFREIYPISALTLDGTDPLLAAIARELPRHPPLYPTDIVSEHSQRFFVSEIIREKIFVKCEQEIPYSTSVDIVEFRERTGGSGDKANGGKGERGKEVRGRGVKNLKWFISADVYVERDSQKGIVIGKGGTMLKEIGAAARKDIEEFLEHPVFLELHVKVREKWREDEQWLHRLGYKQ